MDDLISRQAALDAVKNLPSVQPRKGKWICPSDMRGFGRCSQCKALFEDVLINSPFFNFCPRCGAYNGGEER